MKKRLVILGSTGSIGRATLDIVSKNIDRIEVLGLSAHSNIDLLSEQVKIYSPSFVVVTDQRTYGEFKSRHHSASFRLLNPSHGIEELTSLPETDIVLNAIVGAAGLSASISAIKAGKRLALANKESMIIGGSLINELLRSSGAELIPVDSEHSAIWQALFSGKKKEIKRIILTGSGGPFRETPLSGFPNITKEQALNHPVWKMGPKISIDSATMMNKGLEVIEAVQLFGVPPEKIKVVIHPQSIIHSLVEFIDSSVIAQMSLPDMRLPIAYALFYPERIETENGHLELTDIGKLTFMEPDFLKFPLLEMGYKVAQAGGTIPAVFNAANEVAVNAFLKDTIKFITIPDIIIKTVEKHKMIEKPAYNDIVEADQWARKTALDIIG